MIGDRAIFATNTGEYSRNSNSSQYRGMKNSILLDVDFYARKIFMVRRCENVECMHDKI